MEYIIYLNLLKTIVYFVGKSTNWGMSFGSNDHLSSCKTKYQKWHANGCKISGYKRSIGWVAIEFVMVTLWKFKLTMENHHAIHG